MLILDAKVQNYFYFSLFTIHFSLFFVPLHPLSDSLEE